MIAALRLILLLLLLPIAIAQDAPDLSKAKVEVVFQQLCSTCHGKNLEGGLGTSLVDGEWKHGAEDAEIFRSIAKGNLQLGMTPWEGILSVDQIRSMVIFIREKEKTARDNGINYPKPEPGVVTKTEHEDYKMEIVVAEAEKLEIPWAIAFLPDGRKLVTERSGRLRVIGADGKLLPDPIKDTPEVLQHGQGGLLEVATHPEYAKNGWIYLGFSDGWREKPEEGKKEGKAMALTAVVRGRIVDHEWKDQEWIYRADRKFYGSAGVHFGTRFVFQDGYIYFVVGERGGKLEAQDVTRPNGKIFRLHDDGRMPEDNPFVAKDGALPGIWSYGHRNPQGLDIDPRNGAIYSTEHGPRGGDELNRVIRGANYGWPVITYGMNYDGTPITSKTHQEGMEQPVTYWVPSIAACGLDFYGGDKFSGWKHDLFAGALKQQELRRLRIADGKVVEQEVVLKNLGRVRDVADGPDGYLYVILNGPDSIIRLVPAEGHAKADHPKD
jgi:glucose/arabinose dehydrogenase